MRQFIGLAVVPIIFAVCSTVISPSAALAAEEFNFLTKEEFLAEFAGNTVTGKDDGKTYYELMLESGSIKGIWGGDRYSGNWCFEGNSSGKCWGDMVAGDPVMKVCLDYEGSDYDGCYRVARDGDKFLFVDDSLDIKYTDTILRGNPENL